MHSKFSVSIAICASLGLALAAAVPREAFAGQLLRGQVDKEGYLAPAAGDTAGTIGPSLSRRDIERAGDPFSGQPDPSARDDSAMHQALDAPQTAFQGASIMPKQPFNLNADQSHRFNGQGMEGIPDATTALLPQNAVPGQFAPQNDDGNLEAGMPQGMGDTARTDPDATPEMQLAWDAWHHRVAQAIFERFNFFATKAFGTNPMLVARVAYVVTREGRITNVRLVQRSPNIMFNALILQCVKSMDGNSAVLQFPQGSQRMTVDKFGSFDMGGRGFRYTVGDREVVSGR